MKKLFFISLAVIGLTLSSCGKSDPQPGPQPIPNDVVDLGLPSGTLWATHNVGATKKSDKGGYFVFGTTSAVSADFKYPDDYKYAKLENDKIVWTKYNTQDAKDFLDEADDAATVIMGKGFRTPTLEQVKELRYNTKAEVTTADGVKGIRLTSTIEGYTDKTIFLPVTSYWFVSKDDTKYNDVAQMQTLGTYMTSNVYKKDGEVDGNYYYDWSFDCSKTGAINAGAAPVREKYAKPIRAVYKK
ncbi:MAG: hypothetical protein IJU69_04760 [Bacteroidales bacterium]|nr:hypothetical protein [Bacteroidales bacterium]